MEHSIILENYRGFSRYTMKELARVNLLVGKNNCGKSALLEGIHILESGGNSGVLVDIAMRRGETVARYNEETAYDVSVSVIPTITHFFYGHQVTIGKSFSISSNGNKKRVSAHIVTINAKGEADQLEIQVDEEETTAVLALKIIAKVH